jgi:protein CpxP
MLRLHRTVLMVAALSPGLASVAVAQTPTQVASSATTTAVDQRIQLLQTQLGITPEQMPLWNAFAQAMRDNAASTEQLFQQRAGAAATMTAVDNMHSYATLARAYADDTAKLSTAFDSLYASLTPTQKQAADTLFRQQATAKAATRR